jgi:hypothetical protein
LLLEALAVVLALAVVVAVVTLEGIMAVLALILVMESLLPPMGATVLVGLGPLTLPQLFGVVVVLVVYLV